MNPLPILITLVCTILVILFAVLKCNRKDEKQMETSLDVADDEEELRSHTRPGEKKES
jgi:preprotein translocase subunit YajC